MRDYCHYTGKYRGALHSKCNLRLKRTRTIPVFAHNLTGYDSHLFAKRLADSPGDVGCIPRNEEEYITFSKRVLVDTIVKTVKRKGKEKEEINIYSNLRFVDTVNFMQTSLEELVGNMERSDFKHTSKYFQGEKLDLMLRKGVYPYEYMTGVEKLWERELPSKEKFASMLNSGIILYLEGMIESKHISDEDYEHVQKVYTVFECKNLANLTKVYCNSDVFLLADAFERFIDECLKKYRLDPSHYITAPSLSMDAMLKMTGVELELLTDVDKHLFFEKGIRGGISIIKPICESQQPIHGKDKRKDTKGNYRRIKNAN